jgi:hypothetical protein
MRGVAQLSIMSSSLVPLCGVALKHSRLLLREASLGPLLAYHVQLSERGAHLES